MNIEPHISLDRVEGVDLIRQIVECYFCHGLLWQPVACMSCDKPFCSTCIQAFHAAQSKIICPHGCSPYTERPNPQVFIRLLVDLKISCRNKSNGCTEIVLYNELKEHEKNCDYQLLSCDGCQQEIMKKNLEKHKGEFACFSLQLQQQKSKTKELEKKLADQQTKIDQMETKLKQNGIFWSAFFLTINETKKMCD